MGDGPFAVATLSASYSVATLASGLLQQRLGRAVDTLGARAVTRYVAGLLSLACLAASSLGTPLAGGVYPALSLPATCLVRHGID